MSITLAPELDHAMREAASKRQETISAWVAGAIEARLQQEREDIETRLREFDEWWGPIPEDIAREVDEEMIRKGLLKREDAA